MCWLCGRIYLFWRWLVATADESGPSSESTPEMTPFLNESTLQGGDSSLPPDIDTRPVGRCHNEMKRLKALIASARTVDLAMREALTAFWACRDAAAAEAYAARQEPFKTPLTATRMRLLESVFDGRESYLMWVERQLETLDQ